jgi:glycosyltransferase involved in cell wall biosynthesis
MTDIPAVYIILTTYRRTHLALRTIAGIKENLLYQNIGWAVADDGSSDEEVDQLVSAIGETNHLWVYKSSHKGTGHNMNVALQHVWDIGGDLTIMLEDDWVLRNQMDLRPYVDVLTKHPQHGMIRFGYISEGVSGTLIKEEGRLYWKLTDHNYTYNYVGHPSLRSRNYYKAYGKYTEGLTPGQTELAACGAFNSQSGPNILIPADSGWYGFFAHCGSESLADVEPEQS